MSEFNVRGAFRGGMFIIGIIAVVALAGLAAGPQAAYAGGYERGSDRGVDRLFQRHPNARYYKYGPQVRGYRRRVGGYSYGRQDSMFFRVFPRIKYGTEPDYAIQPSH